MTDGTAHDTTAESDPLLDSEDRDSLAVVYLKGLAMGAADVVPGVSGGTIALIVGIYERLITAIAAVDVELAGTLRGVHTSAGRRRCWRAIREADLAFLLVLGLGAITSVVVLSRFLHRAVDDFPAPTYAFFFGLIGASAVVLYRELEFEGPPSVLGIVAGFLVGFLVAGVSEGSTVEPGLAVVFATGAVTITAMILPGVSGAFILLLLGQYEYMTGVLERFVDAALAVATGGDATGLLEGTSVVVTFGAGAVVGLLTVANAIRWALSRQRAATLAFLVSLMVGSLRLPIAEVGAAVDAWSPAAAATVAIPAVVGGVAVLALDYYTDDLDVDPGGRTDR